MKRILWLMCCCLLLLPTVVGASVYDQAGELTAEEVTQLEQLADQWGAEANMDLAIVTVTGVAEGELDAYLKKFKEQNQIGAGYEGNAAVIGIAPDTRDLTLVSFGPNKDILSNSTLGDIRYDVQPYLSEDDLVGGFSLFLELASTEVIEYEPYDGDVFFNKWWFHLLIAVTIALIIMITWIAKVGGSVTEEESHYIDTGQSHIVREEDTFIRTVVTQTEHSNSDSGNDSSYNSSSGKY